MWLKYLFIALGGAVGSILRAFMTTLLMRIFGMNTFPLGTFFVNIVGCLMIGILGRYFQYHHPDHPYLAPLFITGFLGGMTTFSSYSLESFVLLQNNYFLYGLMNICGQLLMGVIAVWLGFKFTEVFLT